jgi:hypothetical protein
MGHSGKAACNIDPSVDFFSAKAAAGVQYRLHQKRKKQKTICGIQPSPPASSVGKDILDFVKKATGARAVELVMG